MDPYRKQAETLPDERSSRENDKAATLHLEQLACDLANAWRRTKTHRPEAASQLDPYFTKALDQLDEMTVGDERRCYCVSKNSGHASGCPARKR